MELAEDIVTAVRSAFDARLVERVLAQVAAATECTRVRRCIVFAARGDLEQLERLCALAKVDFRDVVVAGEYSRTGERLYDFNREIPDAAFSRDH